METRPRQKRHWEGRYGKCVLGMGEGAWERARVVPRKALDKGNKSYLLFGVMVIE
jgi:hypothetical protein